MKFSYEVVASGLHDAAALQAAFGGLEEEIARRGGVRVEEGAEFILVATGGVEREVLRRLEGREKGRPALLLAHVRHNSLPAALEILGRVQQDGGSGRIYLLKEGKSDDWAALEQTARCLEARRKLAAETIGCVGEASAWLVASSQNAEAVARRFGVRMEAIDLQEWRAATAEEAEKTDETGILEGAQERTVSVEEYRHAMAAYRGLRKVVERHGLAGVTVKCFDYLLAEKTTGCLALSQLADEGISAGCEGDVTAIVAMRWLWHLTGQVAWMANPAEIDAESGRMHLAHCTVPRKMLEGYGLKTHFESGTGVALDGELKRGAVTLVRLGGREMDRCWVAEGELTDTTHQEHLCRTQAWIQLQPKAAKELLARPLGNHLVMVEGRWGAAVREGFGLLAAGGAANE